LQRERSTILKSGLIFLIMLSQANRFDQRKFARTIRTYEKH